LPSVTVIEETHTSTRRTVTIVPCQSADSSAPTSPESFTASSDLPTPPATPSQQSNASIRAVSPSSSTSSHSRHGSRIEPESAAPLTPPATPCPQPHRVTRKPITEDCGICYERICCPDEAVWCRAQCGQNIHRECFAEWRQGCLRRAEESRMDDDESEEEEDREQAGLKAVKCVFCRTPWKWEWQD